MKPITMGVRFSSSIGYDGYKQNPFSTFTGTAAGCLLATGQSDAASTLITTV